jgi:hypothetical protein
MRVRLRAVTSTHKNFLMLLRFFFVGLLHACGLRLLHAALLELAMRLEVAKVRACYMVHA